MGRNALRTNHSGHSGGTDSSHRGFSLLSPQFLDELRARVTLSTIVSRSVPLKRAGNEFKACCPFHQEKTPSFWVNDQKGFFHCFGCGAHGDAIRFLTDAIGLPFRDAVQELADSVGLGVPTPSEAEKALQERAATLTDVMEAATVVFERVLSSLEGTAARAYLDNREIGSDARAVFRIGYSPDERHRLKRELDSFDVRQLVDSGLLIEVDQQTPYDRFRGRLMIPIRDPRGRVIGFGGRLVAKGEPKYLNSPETPLFDKGRVLFNLDRAGPASRRTNRILVVEGYLDVVTLDQAGVHEAVAPMGTALTEAQLEQLWRLVDQPILCFDGDKAGLRAAEKAAARSLVSLRPGKHLLIAVLPDGTDPDDLIRARGAAAFEDVLAQAQPLAAFLFASELAKIDQERPEQRAMLRHKLDELASSCADRLIADEFSRSFRSMFYEQFGWKGNQRRVIAGAIVRTSTRVAPNLAKSFVRSALYGLTRFPEIARDHMDIISTIKIDDRDLSAWRDVVLDVVFTNPNMTEDGIHAIIESNLVPEIIYYDLVSDLRFGFTRKHVDRTQAHLQLEALLVLLAEEQALNAQLSELNRQAMEAHTADEYELVEAARQRVRRGKAELFHRSMDWDGSRSSI